MESVLRAILLILAFISIGNIGVAVLVTMIQIEKMEKGKKGVGLVLFFAFTIIGLYAIEWLRELS